ncbi:MAG TPA: hypothetical protein VHA75_18915 [Rugosimonospora sp.]|nr:hypothetical protein [Rugosimonospora sp.]
MKKRNRIAAVAAAIAAAGAAVGGAAIVTAQDPAAATANARPLGAWFSVVKDGAPAPAAAVEHLVADNTTLGPDIPAPSTAVVARETSNGPVLVRANDTTACIDIPAVGGGCFATPLKAGPSSPPVLVGGPGQSAPVKSSWFSALVGDGVESIAVSVEGSTPRVIPVRDNVVLEQLPGRVLRWSWTDPDGTEHSRTPDLTRVAPD